MQVVAMVAFLGCFAILAIAAGTGKAKHQENCGEEWKKALQQEKKAETSVKAVRGPLMVLCGKSNSQDLNLPVQLLHKLL